MSSVHDRLIRSIAAALAALAACSDPAPAPGSAAPTGSAAPNGSAAAPNGSTAAPNGNAAAPNGNATSSGSAAPNGNAAATGSAASSGSSAAGAPAGAPIIQRAPAVVAIDEPRLELPHEESFRLLDPGHGARSPLRYALAAGTTAFTARTALSSRHLDGGQFTPPAQLPAIRDGFAIAIAADHPDRLALVALPGEAAATTPATDGYLAPWRAKLQGRHIAVAFDDRGRFSAITFDDDPTGARGEQARNELVQRLLTLIVPLPAEPVGDGASWRVVTILRQDPAYAKQTATYTLTSRSGHWKLHVKLQRVAEEQHLVDPALPPGTSADLLALFRALEGDIEVDPAHPLIAAGSLAIESRMHVRLQDAGRPATEQLFEDTGSVTFALCRPVGPGTHPAPAPAPGKRQPQSACPDGFSPRP